MAPPSQEEEEYKIDLPTNASMSSLRPNIYPFAGAIGGNQGLVLSRDDPENEDILKKVPDAAPLMSLRDGFSLNGFKDLNLWKFGLVECVGTMMHVFFTVWVGIRQPVSPSAPATVAGVYGTAAFLGPLVGGTLNCLSLSLFIFAFANTTGAHLNPTITLSTFFARLISFPRMVIYLAAQTLGGTLAGLMLRTAHQTRDFTVGGCAFDEELVSLNAAFLLEFIFSLTLIFLAFGVGLDPRQGKVYGPGFSPFLVGLTLGIVSFGSAFTLEGYGGAGMNPTRCFGAYTATSFPHYHWIHWVGPLAAAMSHGVVYFIVPPWHGQ